MNQMILFTLSICVCGIATFTAAQPPSAGTSSPQNASAWSIEQARIQFTGRRGKTQNLYRLDRTTNRVSRLTEFDDSTEGANNGRVSPDGQQIVFQVRRGNQYDIHLMPTAGGKSTPLIEHPDYDVGPVWSPDGRQVAFMSTRGYELGSIGPFPGHMYVVNADGSGLRQVTREPLTSSLGPSDWSPDGTQLLLYRAWFLPIAYSWKVQKTRGSVTNSMISRWHPPHRNLGESR